MNSDSLNMVSRLGEGHMPCTFFLSEPQLKTTVYQLWKVSKMALSTSNQEKWPHFSRHKTQLQWNSDRNCNSCPSRTLPSMRSFKWRSCDCHPSHSNVHNGLLQKTYLSSMWKRKSWARQSFRNRYILISVEKRIPNQSAATLCGVVQASSSNSWKGLVNW